jgi:hypothetical protein
MNCINRIIGISLARNHVIIYIYILGSIIDNAFLCHLDLAVGYPHPQPTTRTSDHARVKEIQEEAV